MGLYSAAGIEHDAKRDQLGRYHAETGGLVEIRVVSRSRRGGTATRQKRGEKVDKSDTNTGETDKSNTKAARLESFASDQKSPWPYTGRPDENTVSVNRMIAKKLYTIDGGVFGQVVDILLDSHTGRMNGVVVTRMDRSGGSANRLVVVPVADLKLTDGKWLITDLSHAG